VTFIEQRSGQFKGRLISSEKAKRLLGWETQFSYREALEKYARWFVAGESAGAR
jgi:nucleoside-diphosphate-sugar epimerase